MCIVYVSAIKVCVVTCAVIVGLILCLCVHGCLFVCVCIYMLKPLLHYSVSACVMFCETWVLLRPAGTLIFHHAVCYTTLYCMKVYVYTLLLPLPLYSSTSPVFLLLHHNQHPTHSPLATHMSTSNQSKKLSRLALEKTP